jgi:toxin ParE1/3/4
MAKIVIRPEAESDLDAIYTYLGRSSHLVAERFLAAVQGALETLAIMPELGSRSESSHKTLADLRIWPIRGFRKYLIFYRVLSDGIEIRRVLHGARDIESLFE